MFLRQNNHRAGQSFDMFEFLAGGIRRSSITTRIGLLAERVQGCGNVLGEEEWIESRQKADVIRKLGGSTTVCLPFTWPFSRHHPISVSISLVSIVHLSFSFNRLPCLLTAVILNGQAALLFTMSSSSHGVVRSLGNIRKRLSSCTFTILLLLFVCGYCYNNIIPYELVCN